MKEQLSALIDGELDADQVSRSCDAIKVNRDLRKCWNEYALIGDVMRGELALRSDFTDDVLRRLEQEPTVLAPSVRATTARSKSAWDRYLPIAATIAGVAVVGWMGVRTGLPATAPASAHPTLVRQQAPAQDTERAYLLAHHGYAGAQAVPGVGYYMRTAADVQNGEMAR
ncbi:hypothetical protein GCM10025771_38990 [Niveibacterium umoris]|uniref:Sigma-E factor negative regulatory protein RseA n=1 Tax=Niveibacterium umoris TaxID=1193620 RepID=A0A840BH00_9RHOO|nr:sigma-E factor negative regulatory protein [Niveibacterium umoris]MBB4010899.1 sigma-E factor negative regulatory protein RseA [Niveibacterium umoris]